MKLRQSSSTLPKEIISRPRRRYHLGLDWGTSAIKLVLRDYDQNKAFVLFPDGVQDSYRYPSTITIEGGRVNFGCEAEKRRKSASRVFDALKADVCSLHVGGYGTDEAKEKEDLATLLLAHVISIGLDHAEMHAGRGDADAVMGMTLGVPAEELEKSNLAEIYLRMARTAYEIAIRLGCDPQGERYCNSLQALKFAREKLSEKNKNTIVDRITYLQWLRPELAAAMYWGIKSPIIQPDLYTCVDIGAWTTNASYFRIHAADGNAKGAISFYGGSCEPPGMIECLKRIANQMHIDYRSLLGDEDNKLSDQVVSNCTNDFFEEYFRVWQKGFHKSYPKQRSQSSWEGKLKVMVVGGGSKVDRIKRMFHDRFPFADWSPPTPVPDLGIPTDLFLFPKEGVLAEQHFAGDHTFLLVAYGLSVDSRDFPHTTLSPQVPPIRPRKRSRKFLGFEELGYDQ